MLRGVSLPSEDLRITALEQAVALVASNPAPHLPPFFATVPAPDTAVLEVADKFLGWLRAGGTPTFVRLYASEPISEDHSDIDTLEEATMTALNTGQKVRLTADPEDAAGFDVDVPVSFTVDDEAVATIVNIEDDPKSVWVVSGAPGSTVVTATVTNLAGDILTGTLAVDVVPADVAVVNIEAGEPEAE